MPAFVKSHSQSQARLMFVTTLEIDNFEMNAHFTACLWEGLIHEWKLALLAPPLPLMGATKLTSLFYTQPLFTILVCRSVFL